MALSHSLSIFVISDNKWSIPKMPTITITVAIIRWAVNATLYENDVS